MDTIVTESLSHPEPVSPFFSIVIPTRNRVDLFIEALESVLAQDCKDREILVVNDGSVGDPLVRYQELVSDYPEVRFYYLVHRANGHGQSYSMNFGAAHARGRYLCFLDDDDYWTDTEHLSRAKISLLAGAESDIYFSNQEAYDSSGVKVTPNPWVKDLDAVLPAPVDDQGSRMVDADLLLSSRGFAHLNCSIYRREFYLSIGGMDENIRYECDRDIYLRGLDRASRILLNPKVVSYHRVPDIKKSSNMSTTVSIYQKRMYQLMVYEKGILNSNRPTIREFCLKGKGYQLKHIAQSLASEKRYTLARNYAWEGFALLPTFRWLVHSVVLSIKSLAGE